MRTPHNDKHEISANSPSGTKAHIDFSIQPLRLRITSGWGLFAVILGMCLIGYFTHLAMTRFRISFLIETSALAPGLATG